VHFPDGEKGNPNMSEIQQREDTRKQAADLERLAYLLTGRRDISVEVAVEAITSQDSRSPFFTGWMQGWAKRVAIAKALTAIREELAESAGRVRMARLKSTALVPRGWTLDPNTSRARIDEALLAMDSFIRVAVLLTIFEAVRVPDVATLLDADAELVRKAQAIGLGELAANLSRPSGSTIVGFPPATAFGLVTS
jgi:hypothetical protein